MPTPPSYSAPVQTTQSVFEKYRRKASLLHKEAIRTGKLEELKNRQPLFALGNIVYLKPTSDVRMDSQYPALSTPYASDCKVLGISCEIPGFYCYELVAGTGGRVVGPTPEELLVHPKDKFQHQSAFNVVLIESNELAPSGTHFSLLNGYYSNEELGIHLEKEYMEKYLRKLFKSI